ncbi:MAG: hypothetical protein ABI572_08935 [Actinomycetota bacterium]
MARIFVEGWDPEYGSPLDQDGSLAPAEGSVDATVEHDTWAPIEGVDDGAERIAFVDGVRRVDARLTLDDPVTGPIPGLCGTFAVGATVWDRAARSSEVTSVRIERWAVLAGGRPEQMPPVAIEPGLTTATCASDDPARLIIELHTKMRRAEGETATALASECFVVADGPLNELTAHPTVGYIKSHRVTYLEPERNAVVAQLAPGQRTPMFSIGDYKRYSWYVRLAMLSLGHSWTGIVRCEVSGQLPKELAVRIADRTAAVLPLVASEPHVDPRAPQNLVPIAALERDLKHRMGDRGLVYRALREAVMEREAS